MSAILIIVNLYSYGTFTETLDLYLAIRSISECVYAVKPSDTEKVEQEFGLKNCLIRLLNSSTVDVDKLDLLLEIHKCLGMIMLYQTMKR